MRVNGKDWGCVVDLEEDQFMNVITGISERRPLLSHSYYRFVSRTALGSGLIDRRRKIHEALN